MNHDEVCEVSRRLSVDNHKLLLIYLNALHIQAVMIEHCTRYDGMGWDGIGEGGIGENGGVGWDK